MKRKMKSTKIFIWICLFGANVYGQWTYKLINNGFDEPYKIAYSATNNGAILKLECVEEEIMIYPQIIQDSSLTILKTKYQIMMYDSLTSGLTVSRGYISVYSDEYIVIYDVMTGKSSSEFYYKVYYDGKSGVMRASDLTINPKDIEQKLLKNNLDANQKISKAMELIDKNKNQKPIQKKVKEVAFYLSGGYHCDEEIPVDISFLVGGTYKKYSVTGIKSENSTVVFLVDDLTTDAMKEDFFKASSVKMRFNESYCESDYFEFKMTGSKAAYNYICN